MRLTISAGGALTAYIGGTHTEVEADQDATVAQVLIRLGIPTGVPVVIFVNGQHCSLTERVQDGDALLLIPAVPGGGTRPE